jgi:hypothetical protein
VKESLLLIFTCLALWVSSVGTTYAQTRTWPFGVSFKLIGAFSSSGPIYENVTFTLDTENYSGSELSAEMTKDVFNGSWTAHVSIHFDSGSKEITDFSYSRSGSPDFATSGSATEGIAISFSSLQNADSCLGNHQAQASYNFSAFTGHGNSSDNLLRLDTLVLYAPIQRTFFRCAANGSVIRKNYPEVSIWPNPASSILRMDLPDNDSYLEVLLVNTIGQRIRQQKQVNQNLIEWDIHDLPEGAYYLEFVSEKKKTITPVFIKR